MADCQTNTITFNEDELTLEGTGHVKSLHIAVECRGMINSRVFTDNGSATNVCPAITLSRIDVGDSIICPNEMTVQAFEGTKTSACGEVDLKILVGQCEFEVPFIILDISVVYKLLLGDSTYTQQGPFHPVYIKRSNLYQGIS